MKRTNRINRQRVILAIVIMLLLSAFVVVNSFVILQAGESTKLVCPDAEPVYGPPMSFENSLGRTYYWQSVTCPSG